MSSITDVMKGEQIVSVSGCSDSKHILNLSDKEVSDEILRMIENGCPLERLEEITADFPICKYQTQITIHGKFPDLHTRRIGGNYVNIVRNKNGSVGVRWSAIDADKRRRLYKICRLAEWKAYESSTHSLLIKEKSFSYDNVEGIRSAIESFKTEMEKIDKSLFFGNITIRKASAWGRVVIFLVAEISAFYESNFWRLAENLTAKTRGELEELKREQDARDAERAEQWRLQLEESRRKARESAAKADEYNARWMSEHPSPFPQSKGATLKEGDVYAKAIKRYSIDIGARVYDSWEFFVVTKSFGKLIATPCDENGKKTGARGKKIDAATGDWFIKPSAKPSEVQVSQNGDCKSNARGCGGKCVVCENKQKNGIEIRFSAVPSESVRNRMKSNGWRWSRYAGAWYNSASEANMAFANAIAEEINSTDAA